MNRRSRSAATELTPRGPPPQRTDHDELEATRTAARVFRRSHGTRVGGRRAPAAPVRRKTFYDRDSNGWVRTPKGGGAAVPLVHDDKPQLLKKIADWIAAALPGRVLGPHVAVSIHHKQMFVGVNTPNDRYPVDATEAQLKAAAEAARHRLVQLREAMLLAPPHPGDAAATQRYDSVLRAIRWASHADPDETVAFGADSVDLAGAGPNFGVLHGEMRILTAMQVSAATGIDVGHLTEASGPGTRYHKAIRIGGTKYDCLDCNRQYYDQEGSKLDQLNESLPAARVPHQVLTAGTHGNAYPGWRDPTADARRGQPGPHDHRFVPVDDVDQGEAVPGRGPGVGPEPPGATPRRAPPGPQETRTVELDHAIAQMGPAVQDHWL